VVEGTCQNPDCTVAASGQCLLSHPDPKTCPNFGSGKVVGIAGPDVIQAPVVEEVSPGKEVGRKFHLGNELGTEDAIEIMRARYTHLIGVLGSTDAGKTCLLSSLYLMASGGTLPPGYQFAGSLTLQAFEDRARGLREWQDGNLPAQLADHTVLTDPRQPSLLHLAVRESSGEGRRLDLLLTDLPGEWTDNLVLRSANAPSFEFLRRADGIILVVDGTLLVSDGRHVELQRMRQFIERLAKEVKINVDTPFVVLVSKSDEIEMQMPPAALELKGHLESFGFAAITVSAAAFSRKPDKIKSGTGVFDAIEALVNQPTVQPAAGTENPAMTAGARTFDRFRA
jgi:GTPase SAR1 family protein